MSTKISALACIALCTGALRPALAPAQVKHLACLKDQSSMTYRLVHPLHKIEATSKDVVYDLEADPVAHTFKHVAGTVDVTTFDSGNSNRDSHAMEVIDAIDYPDASFEGSGFIQRGDSLYACGKITFHGITKDVTIGAVPHWTESRLEVDGSFSLSLTEFKIDRPSLLMIPVDDALNFTFTAVFGTQ